MPASFPAILLACSSGPDPANYVSSFPKSFLVREAGGRQETNPGDPMRQPGRLTSSLSALGRVSGGTGCIVAEAQCEMERQASCTKVLKISSQQQNIEPVCPRAPLGVAFCVTALIMWQGLWQGIPLLCDSDSHLVAGATQLFGWLSGGHFFNCPLPLGVAVASCGRKSSDYPMFSVSSFSFCSICY